MGIAVWGAREEDKSELSYHFEGGGQPGTLGMLVTSEMALKSLDGGQDPFGGGQPCQMLGPELRGGRQPHSCPAVPPVVSVQLQCLEVSLQRA